MDRKSPSNDVVSIPTVSWTRGKCIGKGSFGAVCLAAYKSNGKYFAVKSVDTATCLPRQLESLDNEIRVLRSLPTSPHVVNYLGDDVTREEKATYRNLHLEYLPRGTVADLAAAAGGLNELLVRRFAWSLVSALRHVHTCEIFHGDVKGKNVLVGDDVSSVKLADFGSAADITDTREVLIAPRGSPLWMAPEVVRGEYQGPESDVWSLGCTIIEMLSGKPAWTDGGAETIIRIGFSGEIPPFPTKLSETGLDFLEKCLRRDPKRRWSCDQLLQHPFLSSLGYKVTESSSPRCVLDRVVSDIDEEEDESETGTESASRFEFSAVARITKLATSAGAIWEFDDDWVDVRRYDYFEVGGTSKEFESEPGTSSVYSHFARAKCGFCKITGCGWQRQFRDIGSSGGWRWSCWYGQLNLVGSAREQLGVVFSCKVKLLSLCWYGIFLYILLFFMLSLTNFLILHKNYSFMFLSWPQLTG